MKRTGVPSGRAWRTESLDEILHIQVLGIAESETGSVRDALSYRGLAGREGGQTQPGR